MPGPTGDVDPPLFVGALRIRGAVQVWAGTNESEFGASGAPGAQSWADTLAIDFRSGTNNPHIDEGQYLSFHNEDALPTVGDIRSSAGLEIEAVGDVLIHTPFNIVLGGHSGAADSVQLNADFFRVTTGATERLEIQSDGTWEVGGAGGTSGQYLRSLGVGSPPSWQTITFSEITGGTWADVLARGNNSGAFNPHVDDGQFLSFGVEGSIPGSGDIRSSDAFTINVTGAASMVGSTAVTITSDGNGLVATPALASFGAGTTFIQLNDSASMVFRTSNVERLEIEATGGWQLGGLVGTAGQYNRSSGPGASPAWATIAFSEITGGTWADVLARGATSGAHNPTIDSGQKIIFSGGGSAGGDIDAAGVFAIDAVTSVGFTTAGVSRLVIEADGSWNIGGSNGTAGQYARSFGGSAPPQWATISASEISGIVATTGAVSIPAGGGASLFAGIQVLGSATTDRQNLNFVGGNRNTPSITDDAGNNRMLIAYDWNGFTVQVNDVDSLTSTNTLDFNSSTSIIPVALAPVGTEANMTFERAALTGAITASQNSNATLFDTNASGAGLTGGGTAVLAVGAGTYITVNANDVAVNRTALAADLDSTSVVNNAGVLERAALTGEVTAPQNGNATTIVRSTNFDWTGDHDWVSATFTVETNGGANSLLMRAGDGVNPDNTFNLRDANGDIRFGNGSATNGFYIDAGLSEAFDASARSINLTASGASANIDATNHIFLTADTTYLTSGVHTNDAGGTSGGFLRVKEAAASTESLSAGDGMYWVRNDAPCVATFTDDVNADWPLNVSGVASNTAIQSVSAGTGTITAASFTIPANTLHVGSIYKLEATGTFERGATATALNITFNIVLAGTTYATATSAAFTAAGVGQFTVHGYLTCFSTGASGVFIANFSVINETAQITTPTAGQVYDAVFGSQNTASSGTTKNTTTALALSLTASMSANVAATTLRFTNAFIMKVA